MLLDLHREEIIHTDIKSDNVMFSARSAVVLCRIMRARVQQYDDVGRLQEIRVIEMLIYDRDRLWT